MNADRVISKINIEMNAFNESGGREDKACAEGLRRARTYVQQEVLKRKILTHDQQVVLDYLKNIYSDVYEDCTPLETMYLFGGRRAWSEETNLTDKEEFQVLAAFAEWGLKEEQS